jgi:hypothetical protein
MIAQESQMYEELTLLLPGSLLSSLEKQAGEQGISLDLLCFRLLSGYKQEEKNIDPEFYTSLGYSEIKSEIRKVMESDLPRHEAKKRITALEFQITRRYM